MPPRVARAPTGQRPAAASTAQRTASRRPSTSKRVADDASGGAKGTQRSALASAVALAASKTSRTRTQPKPAPPPPPSSVQRSSKATEKAVPQKATTTTKQRQVRGAAREKTTSAAAAALKKQTRRTQTPAHKGGGKSRDSTRASTTTTRAPKASRGGRPHGRATSSPTTEEEEQEESSSIEDGPTQPLRESHTAVTSSGSHAVAGIPSAVLTELTTAAADVEHHLCLACCRVLPKLTVGTQSAFLTVAAKGRDPATSAAASTTFSAEHEEVYRTVRSTVAASCTLGHRSCQALWGPRGSGKHRIMRLLVQDCAKQPNTLVLHLHGRLLKGDLHAIRVIAQQMLRFLQSPQSAALRAADWSIRTGSFDFGHLFHFEKLLANAEQTAAAGDGESVGADGEGYSGASAHAGGAKRRGKAHQAHSAGAARKRVRQGEGAGHRAVQRSPSSSSASSDRDLSDDDEDDDDGDESSDSEAAHGLFVTSTTAYLAGGAASALPALQRALVLMKSYGTNIVVCIRHVELFGVWCDQLLYVLSGLMHEGTGMLREDGRGHEGGMSLVLTTAAPDVRLMEKRLSSRLTCETRFVPLLSWTPLTVLRAVVRSVRDEAHAQLETNRRAREAEAAAAIATTTDATRHLGKGARKVSVSSASEAITFSVEASVMSTVFPTASGPSPPSAAAAVVPPRPNVLDWSSTPLAGWRTEWPPPTTTSTSMATDGVSATLPIELLLTMCDEVIDELQRELDTSEASESTPSSPRSVVSRTRQLSKELLEGGGTAPEVVTAVAHCLCKASAGALAMVSSTGRERVLQWLVTRWRRERVLRQLVQASAGGGRQRQLQPPHAVDAVNEHGVLLQTMGVRALGGGGLRVSAPYAIQQRWNQARDVLLPTAESTRSAAETASSPPPQPPQPPDLFDLLDDGRLIQMGYGSREVFLTLFYVLLRHEAGVARSVPDLLEDVASSLGTKAAAALDRAAFRLAIAQLHRWRVLHVTEGTEIVSLCGSEARLREFLVTVLERRMGADAGLPGLDSRELARIRSLLR